MATITWLALVAFAAVANAAPHSPPYPPMENPNLYGGDILILDEDRNAVPTDKELWKNATIPYEIDDSLADYTARIREAMDHIENTTCVRFVPRNRQRDHIHIFSGEGCYAMWGYQRRGEQLVSLDNRQCMGKGIILHELMHIVGFDHEHKRSDRDDYVTINWENITPGGVDQFTKFQPWENRLLTPFDYNSVMMYGEYTFTKSSGLKTMVAKKPGVRLQSGGWRMSLSSDDIKRANMLYKCPQR